MTGGLPFPGQISFTSEPKRKHSCTFQSSPSQAASPSALERRSRNSPGLTATNTAARIVGAARIVAAILTGVRTSRTRTDYTAGIAQNQGSGRYVGDPG